jgi:hypothetical protein
MSSLFRVNQVWRVDEVEVYADGKAVDEVGRRAASKAIITGAVNLVVLLVARRDSGGGATVCYLPCQPEKR